MRREEDRRRGDLIKGIIASKRRGGKEDQKIRNERG